MTGRWGLRAVRRRVGGEGRAKRVGVALAAVAFVGLVGTGLSASSAPAAAVLGIDSCTFMPDASGNLPIVIQDNSENAVNLIIGDTPTRTPSNLYTTLELTEGRGHTWSTYGRTLGDEAGCNILDDAQSMLATMVLALNQSFVGLTLTIYALTMNTDGMFATLLTDIEGPAKGLLDSFVKPAMLLGITLSGIVMSVRALRSDGGFRESATDLMWTMGIGITTIVLLTGNRYSSMITAADKSVATINAGLSSAFLTQAGSDACSASSVRQAPRGMACQMWETLEFNPWAIGQFGSLGSAPIDYTGTDYTGGRMPNDARYQQVWLQTFDVNEMGTGSMSVKTKQDNWGDFADRGRKIANGDITPTSAAETAAWKQMYAHWRGEGSGSRFTIAFNAIGNTALSSVGIIGIGVIQQVWRALPVLLLAVLPLAAGLAMFPTQRKHAMGWLETFCKSYVLQLAFGFAMAVLLFFVQRILAMNHAPPITAIYQLVAIVGVWMAFTMVKGMGPKFNGSIGQEAPARRGRAAVAAGAGIVATRARKSVRSGSKKPAPKAPTSQPTPSKQKNQEGKPGAGTPASKGPAAKGGPMGGASPAKGGVAAAAAAAAAGAAGAKVPGARAPSGPTRAARTRTAASKASTASSAPERGTPRRPVATSPSGRTSGRAAAGPTVGGQRAGQRSTVASEGRPAPQDRNDPSGRRAQQRTAPQRPAPAQRSNPKSGNPAVAGGQGTAPGASQRSPAQRPQVQDQKRPRAPQPRGR